MNKFLICFYIVILIILSIISTLIFINKKYNNIEKRKMLYCLISFIIVTISAILLEIPKIPNTISLIILIISFVLFYFLYKENKIGNKLQGNKEVPLIPKRLNNNLKILSQSSNNYIYTSKSHLVCCDKSSFKVKFNGRLENNILKKHYITKNSDNHLSIDCICNKCKKEIEVFNNIKEGYNVIISTKDPEYTYDTLENFICKKCNSNDYKVTITYDYLDSEEEVTSINKLLKQMQKEDYTKTFIRITITITCNKCGKKYKNIINYKTT